MPSLIEEKIYELLSRRGLIDMTEIRPALKNKEFLALFEGDTPLIDPKFLSEIKSPALALLQDSDFTRFIRKNPSFLSKWDYINMTQVASTLLRDRELRENLLMSKNGEKPLLKLRQLQRVTKYSANALANSGVLTALLTHPKPRSFLANIMRLTKFSYALFLENFKSLSAQPGPLDLNDLFSKDQEKNTESTLINKPIYDQEENNHEILSFVRKSNWEESKYCFTFGRSTPNFDNTGEGRDCYKENLRSGRESPFDKKSDANNTVHLLLALNAQSFFSKSNSKKEEKESAANKIMVVNFL